MLSYQKLKPGYFFQFLASFLATLSMISDGMQYGWSSPVIPILRSEETPVKILPKDEVWLEALFLLAGIVAFPLTPILVDKIGRHRTIQLSSLFSIVGWVILGIASQVEHLYIGRFILGLMSVIIFVSVPMYISEISSKEIRGFLTGLVYIMCYVGLILMYTLAPFVGYHIPNLVIVVVLGMQIVLFSAMPESPYFFIKKGRNDSALDSMRKLRGTKDCEAELQEKIDFYKNNSTTCSFKDVILKKSTLKGLTCLTILIIGQHFCGYIVILMNLHSILEEAGSFHLDSNTSGILFVSSMCLAAIVFSSNIDRCGRKVFSICSSTGTGVCILGLAIYCHVRSLGVNVDSISWLPIVFLILFGILYNVGLSLVPKVLSSELFPMRVKALGMTYGDVMFALCAGLSILLYKYLMQVQEMYVPFYIFSGISFVVTLLTILVVPETKGKSLEEIQVMFEK